MSPRTLVAEGPMPGRPSLLGGKISVVTGDADKGNMSRPLKVVHEDASGVITEDSNGDQAALAYPFNYLPVEDAIA